jgi:hypothetical protein
VKIYQQVMVMSRESPVKFDRRAEIRKDDSDVDSQRRRSAAAGHYNVGFSPYPLGHLTMKCLRGGMVVVTGRGLPVLSFENLPMN